MRYNWVFPGPIAALGDTSFTTGIEIESFFAPKNAHFLTNLHKGYEMYDYFVWNLKAIFKIMISDQTLFSFLRDYRPCETMYLGSHITLRVPTKMVWSKDKILETGSLVKDFIWQSP